LSLVTYRDSWFRSRNRFGSGGVAREEPKILDKTYAGSNFRLDRGFIKASCAPAAKRG
jgi:hypothetical protein